VRKPKQKSTHRPYTPSRYLRRSLAKTSAKKQTSKWEVNLAEELAKTFFVTSNNRTVLKPYEVDIIFTNRKTGEAGLLEVNGPVHYTPMVYGERAHKHSHRNDMRKLRKAANRNLKILLVPAQHRMPTTAEVYEAIALYESAAGSFSMLFAKMGKISAPLT
jgi:hypothetical protein